MISLDNKYRTLDISNKVKQNKNKISTKFYEVMTHVRATISDTLNFAFYIKTKHKDPVIITQPV